MEEGVKNKRKSTPRTITLKKEGQGAKGFYAIFEITFDNAEKGDYFAKTNPQTDFKEGVEIEYQIEKKVNGNFTNYVITLPYAGKGGKGFNPAASNKQTALLCAVHLCCSDKIEKAKIYETANNFLKYLNGETGNEPKTPAQ